MYKLLTEVLILTVVITLASTARPKPECPKTRHRLPLRLSPSADNRNRGRCQVTGDGQDTCRNPQLTCCPNIKGEMMCVSVQRIERKRLRSFFRHFRARIMNEKPESHKKPAKENCPEAVTLCSNDNRGDGPCEMKCPYSDLDRKCKSDADCNGEGESCCQNPCNTNDPDTFCLNLNTIESPPASAKQEPEPPKQEPTQLHDEASDKKLHICPAFEPFDGCIGWAEVPGMKGTGICETDDECASDRKCCQLDNCGFKYCALSYSLEPGCPVPEYFGGKPGKKCKDSTSCAKGEVCCTSYREETKTCVKEVV